VEAGPFDRGVQQRLVGGQSDETDEQEEGELRPRIETRRSRNTKRTLRV
jgi:hypothetical protein